MRLIQMPVLGGFRRIDASFVNVEETDLEPLVLESLLKGRDPSGVLVEYVDVRQNRADHALSRIEGRSDRAA